MPESGQPTILQGTGNRIDSNFGATHNPYDLAKTCGGSSGGAAVALSCGMVPVASGSDEGGSLRNPAAWCNIVGSRPSIGRVPNPSVPFGWSTLFTNGCLGRSTADLALALSTIAGPDISTPLSINEPGSLFARPLERSFKGVRVAWFKDLNGIPIDPRVRAVVDAQRRTFESLGCIVEQPSPTSPRQKFLFASCAHGTPLPALASYSSSIPKPSKTRSVARSKKASPSLPATSPAPRSRTRRCGGVFKSSWKTTNSSGTWRLKEEEFLLTSPLIGLIEKGNGEEARF